MSGTASTPLLELTEISKHYRTASGTRAVLSGVSLALYPNEVLWLQGGSGAGKSSLLRIAAAMSTPTTGTVRVKGQIIEARTATKIRRQEIGMVFQNGNLLPGLSLRDNVAIASATPDYDRIDGLLAQFGLSADANTLGKQASGGQAQRCALCRALVNDPAIILADEPTAGLDSANSDIVMSRLKSAISATRGVVVASHDDRFAQLATRRVRIEGGEIV